MLQGCAPACVIVPMAVGIPASPAGVGVLGYNTAITALATVLRHNHTVAEGCTENQAAYGTRPPLLAGFTHDKRPKYESSSL